ncbi:VOC family protein [Micromonospora sp. NPDC049523]|uniref:VOC family protein n=1 Tax=Micromonospora sp. NPDC049523 TaxID=3155921 RepID=UPI0034165E04
MEDRELLNIGAFALVSGLSIAALRHYDEIGLFKPARVDPDSGYRQYAHDQVEQARLICGLRAVDLPIDEIRALLAGSRELVPPALDAHRERLVAQVRELSQRVVAVDEFIEKGELMPALQTVHPAQIRIGVTDVRAAASFYTKAFDVVFNEAIGSLQFGTHHSERFFLITLEEAAPDSTDRGRAHFGLLVEDVDAAHARALAAGGAEVQPPTDFTWKPRASCVRDPSGNLIDLYQG